MLRRLIWIARFLRQLYSPPPCLSRLPKMPVISGEIARHVVDPVFRAQLFFSDCGRAFQLLFVALEEGDLMSQSGKFMNAQGYDLKSVGLQLVARLRDDCEERSYLRGCDSRKRYRDRVRLSSSPPPPSDRTCRELCVTCPARRLMRQHIAWIALDPQISGLPCLFKVA